MLRILRVEHNYLSPIGNSMGFFYVQNLAGIAGMCELSNKQVFSNWQECNKENRTQGAQYWYDFMVKRAERGYKGAKDCVDRMDSFFNK